MPEAPRPRRVRATLVAIIERPLLFAFWAFVFWGTLLIAVFGVRVASAGLGEAVTSVWPEGAGGLAMANLGAMSLAVVVWLTVAGLAFLNRRRRT